MLMGCTICWATVWSGWQTMYRAAGSGQGGCRGRGAFGVDLKDLRLPAGPLSSHGDRERYIGFLVHDARQISSIIDSVICEVAALFVHCLFLCPRLVFMPPIRCASLAVHLKALQVASRVSARFSYFHMRRRRLGRCAGKRLKLRRSGLACARPTCSAITACRRLRLPIWFIRGRRERGLSLSECVHAREDCV